MLPLMPGIHLLIKRTRAPIVPVGIAGAYDAWPICAQVSAFPPPLFWPRRPGTIAISLGEAGRLRGYRRDGAGGRCLQADLIRQKDKRTRATQNVTGGLTLRARFHHAGAVKSTAECTMNQTILSLAHPDDAEFLCAGTLIRLKQEHGWEVHIASMTPGDCGSVEHGAPGDQPHPPPRKGAGPRP